MSVSKHTKARYDTTARTPAQEMESIYAKLPRPAAVMIQDAEGRFVRPAGSAQVYPDRAEITLTPEGAAALAQAQQWLPGGQGEDACMTSAEQNESLPDLLARRQAWCERLTAVVRAAAESQARPD